MKEDEGDAVISLSHDNIFIYAGDKDAWSECSKPPSPHPKHNLADSRIQITTHAAPGDKAMTALAKDSCGTEKQRFSRVLPFWTCRETPPPGRYWAFFARIT